MGNKKRLATSGMLALMSIATAAMAQVQSSVPVPIRPSYSYPAEPAATGAAAIQMGESPLFITPFLGTGVGYDDNLFYASNNEKSSWLYVLSPGVSVNARSPSSVFRLDYQNQIGRYTSSANDDYVDNTSRASFDMMLNPHSYARLGYDYILGHDPRGLTDRPSQVRPDRYRLWGPNATIAYGTPDSAGRIEGYYSNVNRDYLNNRDTTFASDRRTEEFGGAFYWRVMPKTRFLIEARRTNLAYVQPDSPFSGHEMRYYAGVTWEATAQTTGTIKVGRLEKDFDNGLFPDFSTTGWEGLITWAPRTYSKFDFYSARFPLESTGLGTFILADATGVLWTHGWSSVLTTGVDLRYERDKYQGFDRTDDIKSIGLKAGYRFRRWLTFGAEYTHSDRGSNQSVFEYDKNFYLITATASM